MDTPLQQLICLGLTQLDQVPSVEVRASILRAAAPHLPEHLAEHCSLTATALELAEQAQMKLRGLIFG